ncbi:MAG: methyltransferase domain-containing protein [Boseongicola sp. SB0673_bin_14]|nr:methyltransferase domain-containing protein [Boseongicola sp. SB0673_bin_14]
MKLFASATVPKPMELEIGALVSELVFGHGYMHYGYFPEGLPEELSLQALGEAQHAYFEKLLETIGTVPGDVHRILDVGSGTGANARGLIGAGFDVTCVSPSTQMNEMARANLPQGTQVIDATFEGLATNARYDLCLFAESFHYIALESALAQLEKYADMGVVIFDYFLRNAAERDAPESRRSTHAAFLEAVARRWRFEVLVDKDVTAAITPTFIVLESLKEERLAPFVRRFRAVLKQRYPLRATVIEMVFGRSMDKLVRKSGRSEKFARSHEYRLIALRRKSATT